MTCTPLFSSLPSGVYIRGESVKQVASNMRDASCCSMHAQEGGGFGQVQTFVV